jgi:hypothetical protein
MMMVDPRPDRVEAKLTSGEYRCPSCGDGRLAPWGFARRRKLRCRGAEVWLRPRRGRCVRCLVTHVMLSTVALLRRRDVAEVIGEALTSRHLEGKSRSVIAAEAEVPFDTACRWQHRFSANSGEIRELFSTLAHQLDASLGPIQARHSPEANALEAIGVAAAAATRRFGRGSLWGFVAGASSGRLLSNTSCLLPP